MARRSKRLCMPGGRRADGQSVKAQGKYYKAGIYARLSSDSDFKKKESIDVQIEIARKFVKEWNGRHDDRIEIVDCYRDLGKTGTNFERAEFKRLMQNIRLGDINCVIVKDLSRFGRNYLEAGNYIEKIFPFLGVRFIAVADGYDTGEEENESRQMVLEVKNLINDMYAKDFSYKAKLSLAQRRQEGSYVGGMPPYGYRTVWEGKVRRLVPDADAAEVVRFIYQRFVETGNYKAVTDELNARRINPPAVYKKCGETYCPLDAEYKEWDKSSVERLLKSETYSGRLVQGKTSITARNEQNRIHKQEKDWVVCEDAHEPIVSGEIFQKAVEMRCLRKERGRPIIRTKS